MSKGSNDLLYRLIKTMTKAEKRHFKVYTSRFGGDKLFVKLFDMLNQTSGTKSSDILKKIPEIKRTQLPNLKAALLKKLLLSLRLMHIKHQQDIGLREKLDHVRILYDRGFYRDSLEVLKKIKASAYQWQYFHIVAEIIDFEKYIESQHITNSIKERAENLSNEAVYINNRLQRINEYSNLSINLYGRYLKQGIIQSKEEADKLKAYFFNYLPNYSIDGSNFQENLYLYQSYVWYHYMRQDFVYYYKYALLWVNLFKQNVDMIKRFRPTYLKGIHNMLTSLFMTNGYYRFKEVFLELEQLRTKERSYSKNEVSLLHLFINIHAINIHFMEGSFSDGVSNIISLKNIINDNVYNWDKHRIMVFRYKIACLYFGSGDNLTCIEYLTEIINTQKPSFKEDIVCFSRILRLIAHYELGNIQLINSEIKSVFRFLTKMNSLQGVIREVLAFIRNTPRMKQAQIKVEFSKLRERLLDIQLDKYESRPFLYLDIISWLESKIEGKPVQEIVQAKFHSRLRT